MKSKGRTRKPKLSLKDHLEKDFKELRSFPGIDQDLPKKWEKHGDLVLLPHNCFVGKIWSQIDQEKLWDTVACFFGVSKIAKKGRISDDGHRTPQVVLLKGVDASVCHVDNKIKYFYDITKCMFSAGNITEKMRMAKLDCRDEIIVDMFAGIGYFTLPLLVHAGAKHVHACEWNPDAVAALKKNLIDNKVENRCSVYEGDNREVCPENIADRIIMGLIPTAMKSLKTACKALKMGHGGTLHIHQNVDSKITPNGDKIPPEKHFPNEVSCNKRQILPEWFSWAMETASLVERTMLDVYKDLELHPEVKANVLHIEKVKSYAPHIDHVVLDLKVIVTSQSTS